MSKVAVVILNFNGEDYLRKFLPFVIKFSKPHEIVVTDNGSTDNSVQVLKKEFPEVSLIEIKQNQGFSAGYNFALSKLKAKYFVLLNSDVEVSEGWLEPMIELMDHQQKVAACQPKILSFHEKEKFEYAGASGGFIDKLGYPFCRGRIFDDLEKDHGQYDEARRVFWATGACLMVRSDVYHELGGLDDDFFAHMEEIDLCWRINNTNYEVYCCPQSHVYHVGGGTLSHNNKRKTFLNFRNGLYLLVKNLNRSELFRKIALRIVLDWVAAIKFAFSGSFDHSFAVFSAHLAFVKGARKMCQKRKMIPKRHKMSKMAAIYQRYITWDYFMRKRKRFSSLDI